MKRLTDAEKLDIALLLLDEHEDLLEYERLCSEAEIEKCITKTT